MKKDIIELTKDLEVLFVDDDKSIQEQIKKLFSMFFKKVDIASDGLEGLELFKKNRYDIIFSDIQMPRMTGLEFLKEVKSINPSQKFVLITAYNRCDYVFDGIKSGVDGFLIKPINLEDFLNTLKRVATIIKGEKIIKEFNEELKKELDKKIKEIEFKTYYDELTKLKNRSALLEVIDKKDFIMILNINNFDSINVVYGYEVGDRVLRYVADCLRGFEDVYYLGNDEFAILKEIKVRDIKIPPFKIDDNHFIPIDFTIGVARGDNLLKKAYLALKEAKKKKNRCVVYSDDLEVEKFHKKVQEYMPILKEALENDGIIPFYQGIYDNKLKKVTKYEVLARIKHKDKIISPFFFIDIAEKGGLITEITKRIIDKSFETFSKNSYEFSINLTEEDLMNNDLISHLIQRTKDFKIAKERIVLEVLEGIGDIENSIIVDKLKILEKLGFKIAIDDFGTMNSNFERVTLLNVDFIKIDGKFIKNIDKDKKSYAIAKAITDFAKSINAKVVAEFVSSEEVQKVVESLDIDYSQGYLFSEPKERIE